MNWIAKHLPVERHPAVRILSSTEVQQLSELFRSEKPLMDQIDFLQERGNNFLKIYAHHQTDNPTYWGAFQNNQLVGSLGSIPTAVQNPFNEYGSTFETDLFVIPQARQTTLVGRLLLARLSHYAYNNPSTARMSFGIEHIPDSLELVRRLMPSKHGAFRLDLTTKLTEVFFTSKIEQEKINRQFSEVQSQKLTNLSGSLLAQWLEMYSASRKNNFLSPIMTTRTIAGLIALDPNCEFVYIEKQGQLVAGTLLLEQSQARKLLWPAKPSLILARLQKIYQPAPVIGSEIRLGLVSLSVDEKMGLSPELRIVFESLQTRALARGLHGLAFRDETPASIEKLSIDQFEFQRRVFVVYNTNFANKNEFERALDQGHLQVRLENCFL